MPAYVYNRSMESDFDSEFRQQVQLAQESQPNTTNKRFLPRIIITGAIFLVIAIAVIIIINLQSSSNIGAIGDITETKESLNDEYQQAISNTPHAEYQTGHKDTAFSSFTVKQICSYLKVSACWKLATPNELSAFKSIETLNSNALDYYLDNGQIVAMTAVYTDSESINPYPYIIYARTGGLYYVFDPNSEYMVNMTMEELFNDIVGVPQFYATERSADGN